MIVENDDELYIEMCLAMGLPTPTVEIGNSGTRELRFDEGGFTASVFVRARGSDEDVDEYREYVAWRLRSIGGVGP